MAQLHLAISLELFLQPDTGGGGEFRKSNPLLVLVV